MRYAYIFIIPFLICMSVNNIHAQTLSQDADGYNTIIAPVSALNLDIASGLANFSFYKNSKASKVRTFLSEPVERCFPILDTSNVNFNTQSACSYNISDDTFKQISRCVDSTDSVNNRLYKNAAKPYSTFGLEIQGKIKDGFGSLFSKGNIASSSSGSLLYGINWSGLHQRNNTKRYVKARLCQEACSLKLDSAKKMITQHLKSMQRQYIIDANGIDMLGNISDMPAAHIKGIITSHLQYPNRERERRILITNTSNHIDQLRNLINALNNIDSTDRNNDINAAWNVYKETDPDILNNPDITKDKLDDKKEVDKLCQKLEKILEETENRLSGLNSSDYHHEYGILETYYRNLYQLKLNCEDSDVTNKKIFKNREYSLHHMFYWRLTGTGSSFLFDLGKDSLSVESRFEKRNFTGYKFDAGYMLQFKTYHFIGINAAVNYTNNLSGLDITTHTLLVIDTTISTGRFSSSEEITAVSGPYDKFNRYDISFDYIYLIRLKPDSDSSHLYLNINPYVRHRIYDDNISDYTNNTVVGFGAHFYNSKDNKIMGGIFVQNNDVFGNHADDKSTFGKRITFGVIARFGFKGYEPK